MPGAVILLILVGRRIARTVQLQHGEGLRSIRPPIACSAAERRVSLPIGGRWLFGRAACLWGIAARRLTAEGRLAWTRSFSQFRDRVARVSQAKDVSRGARGLQDSLHR